MRYQLYDLKISVRGDAKKFNCSHKLGECLVVSGENFAFCRGVDRFSHYAFATLLPYISAKQRVEDEKDWMYYESAIACPDPQCGAIFVIERIGKRMHEYGDA